MVPWRSRAEPYLLPVMVVLTVAYARVSSSAFLTAGSWLAVTARTGELLFIIGPLCALSGAWEGARWRRSGWDSWGVVRGGVVRHAQALWPTLVLGAIGLAAALAALSPAAIGAPGLPDARLLGIYLLVTVAHASVGYLLGCSLHPALSVPVAPILSYLWLAYSGAISVIWPRHLAGMYLADCCAIDQVPALRALLAVPLAAGAVIGACLLLSGVRRVVAVSGWLATTAAMGAAVMLVLPLGPEPVEPRHGRLDCAGTRPVVCLWPEQAVDGDRIRATLRTGYASLSSAGLTLPGLLTAEEPAGSDRLLVPAAVSLSRDELLTYLGAGILPDLTPDCGADRLASDAAVRDQLVGWLAVTAGADLRSLSGRLAPEDLRLVRQVRRLPATAQLRWFRASQRAVEECRARPDVALGLPRRVTS